MSEPRRVRVVSDGTGVGTRIYGTDGTDLTNLLRPTEATIRISGGQPAVLTLTIPNVVVDAVADDPAR